MKTTIKEIVKLTEQEKYVVDHLLGAQRYINIARQGMFKVAGFSSEVTLAVNEMLEAKAKLEIAITRIQSNHQTGYNNK